MSSPYDNYDYPSYWKGRSYEHRSETLVIKSFLKKLPKIKNILEIGAGYGRLTNIYKKYCQNIILSDPSGKLLKIAKNDHNDKNIKFLISDLQHLKKHIKPSSIQLVLMVRVIHHIKNCKKAISIINKLLKRNGYLILEFPNKIHIKNIIKNSLKGNFKFINDIVEIDIKKNFKKNPLPFKNYHPQMIIDTLKNNGFNIIYIRSSSNIRSPLCKYILGTKILLKIEKRFHKVFSKLRFGPSIFILAQKKDN
ncbi:methyltransferase domain-containing protein [Candidatus Woesebacteria bacterium]|nr:methyltransferase domain-containing protein [Candidatus Woesebacteria bacterium]